MVAVRETVRLFLPAIVFKLESLRILCADPLSFDPEESFHHMSPKKSLSIFPLACKKVSEFGL